MTSPPAISLLEVRLGYCFADRSLLEDALTHGSFANEHARLHTMQSLAFLGDAVVELAVRHDLFAKERSNPLVAKEDLLRTSASASGRMSIAADKRVANLRLAQVAFELGLGSWIKLGSGAEDDGLRENKMVLADAFEAVVGAIYLDAGEAIASRVALRLMMVHAPKTTVLDVLAPKPPRELPSPGSAPAQ